MTKFVIKFVGHEGKRVLTGGLLAGKAVSILNLSLYQSLLI